MKEKAIWVKCSGEAHSPGVAGLIDHCGVCMPYWEYFPVCNFCYKRLTEKGFCHRCRKYCEVKMKRSKKQALEMFEIADEWDEKGKHFVVWRCCSCGGEETIEGGSAPKRCLHCVEETVVDGG
jgi:hypothetical protein